MFGKASWSTPRPGVPLPPPTETEERGFSYVKRDVVRLIGILCYENRAVQDRVRLCGGITAVMNLCITDERNPCTFSILLSAITEVTDMSITLFLFIYVYCLTLNGDTDHTDLSDRSHSPNAEQI